VPVSRPELGLVPIAMVTEPVKAGVVLPNTSRAVTSTAGAIAEPRKEGLGCTVNARREAAPGFTVTSGGVLLTAVPLTVAPIVVAVPAARPVKLAV